MKILKISALFIAAMAVTMSLSSCGGSNASDGHDDHSHDKMEMNDADHEHVDHQDGTEMKGDMTETHACPMHPDIKGKEGDKCSKCGMDLELIDKDDQGSHSH